VTLTPAAAAPTTTAVRLSDLALQPLDMVYVTRGVRDAAGPQELEARIHAAALAATGASRDAAVAIAFADTGLADPTVAPMADALALFDLAHQVISGCAADRRTRCAHRARSRCPKEPNLRGSTSVDLRTRFGALKTNADTLVADLATAVTNAQAPGAGGGAAQCVARRFETCGPMPAFRSRSRRVQTRR
jgi:hypothetical protein